MKIYQPIWTEVTFRDGRKERKIITIVVVIDLNEVNAEYNENYEQLEGNFMPYDIFLGLQIDEKFQRALMDKMYSGDDETKEYGISTSENIGNLFLLKRTKFYSFRTFQ